MHLAISIAEATYLIFPRFSRNESNSTDLKRNIMSVNRSSQMIPFQIQEIRSRVIDDGLREFIVSNKKIIIYFHHELHFHTLLFSGTTERLF